MTATPTPDNNADEVLNIKPKSSKKRKAVTIVSIILAVILVFVSTFFIIVKIGEKRLRNSLASGKGADISTTEADADDSAIYHNGKAYYYNENLINFLFLGIDRYYDDKETQGQADAIYLFSVDTDKSKVKIISISRNTMCDVDILNSDGEAYGTENQQICLAYAYGNSNKRSSENCTKAVSNLLYGVPINGYYTLHFDSISQIVDSVGGVSVYIPTDFTNPVFDGKRGKTVKLNGNDSLIYLRTRGESNAPRVERHKQFIGSFVSSAKTAVKKDLSLPFKMAKRLSREATTNLDISSILYLATEALDWELEFANVAGEYSVEDNVEKMTVDDAALRQLVIDCFYAENKTVK